MKKNFILGIVMGIIYSYLEAVYDAIINLCSNQDLSLRGEASIWMILVGGMCMLLIGKFNENKYTTKYPIWLQSIIGALIILVIEFMFGVFGNNIMHWNLWDYSDQPFNVYGQICLPFALLWYFLVPFGIWLDDVIRVILFKEERVYSLIKVYSQLFPFNLFNKKRS